MQINGNVARMDEILNIPEMPETAHPKKPAGDDVVFNNVSFSYTGDNSEKALENVSFSAKQDRSQPLSDLPAAAKVRLPI